jgi:hypothetical protein
VCQLYVNRTELQRASLVGLQIGDTNELKERLFEFSFLFSGLCRIPPRFFSFLNPESLRLAFLN